MVSLRLRQPGPLALLGAGLLLAWASAVVALHLGFATAPGGQATVEALTYGVPAALTVAALLRRAETPALALAAGFAVVVTIAVVLPSHAISDPKIALAIPAAVVAGVLTQRFPATALSAVFLLAGTYGSIRAFTAVPGDSVMDKIVVGLWVGVVGRMLIGRRRVAVRATPTLFVLGAFLIACIVAAVTTDPVGNGIRALRLAPLFLSLVVLVGWGGFSARTLDRAARAMVVIALLGSAYAALRWAIGPAAKEQALQRTALDVQYNQLAITGDAKVQGALPNGVLLGLWSACVIPFLVAIAISWRNVYRLLALAALPMAGIALLGSAQRAGLAAAIAGSLAVVVVHVLSRSSRGPRLGVAVGTALALILGAAVVYPAVVNNPEKQKRYENLLSPSEDTPFQERLNKWSATLDAIEQRRWGYGLGAGNPTTVSHRFADIANYEIDNSYLMIAYDQGLLVLGLFAAAMLVLLVELLRHAVWTRGPGGAVLAAAGAGTLVSLLAEFLANDFVYAPVVVAGWMIVGLGAAQFARRDQRAVETASAR